MIPKILGVVVVATLVGMLIYNPQAQWNNHWKNVQQEEVFPDNALIHQKMLNEHVPPIFTSKPPFFGMGDTMSYLIHGDQTKK